MSGASIDFKIASRESLSTTQLWTSVHRILTHCIRENDNVILETNDSVIINVDEEVNSSKLLYRDVTSDIALFGNLIKYLEIAKRKGGKGSKK